MSRTQGWDCAQEMKNGEGRLLGLPDHTLHSSHGDVKTNSIESHPHLQIFFKVFFVGSYNEVQTLHYKKFKVLVCWPPSRATWPSWLFMPSAFYPTCPFPLEPSFLHSSYLIQMWSSLWSLSLQFPRESQWPWVLGFPSTLHAPFLYQ